jgi:hypothetical protein
MKRLEDMTEVELGNLMTDCARAVRSIIQRRTAGRGDFALLVFDDPKVAQYISTCERECMIEALRETAERLENREDVPRA